MGAFSEQYPVTGLRRVELRLHRGDVQVVRTSGDMVQISADNSLSAEVTDGVLTIGPGEGHYREGPRHKARIVSHLERGDLGASISQIVSDAVDSIFKADFRMHGLGSATVRLGIPAGLERPEIVASTGSGDIQMRGLTADCSLQSHSGDVDVADGAGTLQVTTGIGDLAVSDFDGPITGRTGSGDARFTRCAGGGVIHTASGDIDAKQIAGPWKLQSGAGDITVEVRDEAVLEIVTGAGDVAVTKGALGQLTIQSGSGDVRCSSLLTGPRHQLQTGNGDIEVAIANPPGARLQILTRNGDVDSEYPLVNVGKQGRHSHGGARYVGNIGDSEIDLELRTASGDISIRRRDPAQADDGAPANRETPAYHAPADNITPVTRSWTVNPISAPPAPIFPNPPVPPAQPEFASEQTEDPGSIEHQPSVDAGVQEAPVETSGGNPRLAVLENLQVGKISVAEAAALLEALSRQNA
jgi:DUF4097 and DUF4098 domain-containing protein YvlB